MKKNKNRFHCFRFFFGGTELLVSSPIPSNTPTSVVLNTAQDLDSCLHGVGGPQVGEVTRLGGVTRLSIQSLILI